MFVHACPECGVDLVACPGDLIADEVFLCEECDTRWVVCPDCGELTDADENWNHEQGVCDSCADNGDLGITVLSFDNPEQMWMTLEELFGEPEPPAYDEDN